ncbi:MAG: GDSL-type esterase/lipase family protein [Cytophagales bacterium]|nr:GDSL-type esterase/lipase family protein [Bernardetiaceae bacterium]MDW8210985.1 GDSL-type esterase/lipase family protein [Cytophagales bacterium]
MNSTRLGRNWCNSRCLAKLQRFYFCCIFAILHLLSANAQPYRFINYSANVIQQPNQAGEGLRHFFLALKQLESGIKRKVHILHLGDSHIQADFFSGRVRELLQLTENFGNGGRGFVFPYAAAGTNNPQNYSVTFQGKWEGIKSSKREAYAKWGLTGVVALTKDPHATLTINPNREHNATFYSITRVKIFYPVFDKNSFNVTVIAEPAELVSSYVSREGFVEFEFSKPQQEITIKVVRSEPWQTEFALQGFSLENDQAGIVYSSAGMNGADVSCFLRCQDLDRQLRALKPDLVVLSLGANDAHVVRFNEESFLNNYRFLIGLIKRAYPKASLLLTTPGDAYRARRYPNPHNAKVRALILQLAVETGAAVWDFYTVMGGLNSVNQWLRNQLASPDRLHLTPKGYVFQGELFYEALMESYRRYWSKIQP